MRRSTRLLGAGACVVLALGLTTTASADPDGHTDRHTDRHRYTDPNGRTYLNRRPHADYDRHPHPKPNGLADARPGGRTFGQAAFEAGEALEAGTRPVRLPRTAVRRHRKGGPSHP